MARTIRLERVPPAEWDPAFRDPWLELLERTGILIGFDEVAQAQPVRDPEPALSRR